MFRPDPAYLVSSLCFSRLSCKVGSSVGTATRAFLAGLVAARRCERREAGWMVAGACVVLAEAGEPELLNSALATIMMASPASTSAEITLVRLSAPIFNYAPVLK